MAVNNHWLLGFNFNVEEWTPGSNVERTIAICSTVSAARAVFYDAIKEKLAAAGS